MLAVRPLLAAPHPDFGAESMPEVPLALLGPGAHPWLTDFALSARDHFRCPRNFSTATNPVPMGLIPGAKPVETPVTSSGKQITPLRLLPMPPCIGRRTEKRGYSLLRPGESRTTIDTLRTSESDGGNIRGLRRNNGNGEPLILISLEHPR